jgi:hypothetical protein
MSLAEALKIIEALLHYRAEVQFEADGADDRVYPSEEEWEAIKVIWKKTTNARV